MRPINYLVTLLLFCTLLSHSHSAPVYKCTRRDGDGTIEFSDLECENMELLFHDREEDATDTIRALINADQIEQARTIATEHNQLELFNQQVEEHRQSISQAMDEQQQASKNQQNEETQGNNEQTTQLQQNSAKQKQIITQLKRQLKKADAVIKKQHKELEFQRRRLAESYRPKYLPSTDEWCQQQGGQWHCSDEKPE